MKKGLEVVAGMKCEAMAVFLTVVRDSFAVVVLTMVTDNAIEDGVHNETFALHFSNACPRAEAIIIAYPIFADVT